MAVFNVEVKGVFVIDAENEDHALSVARHYMMDAVRDNGLRIKSIDRIEKLSELRDKWDGMCFPYGETGKRLSELLAP